MEVNSGKSSHHSFYDYTVCEIENVPSLEVIEMGELNIESWNFYYASLELKSDSQRIELMNRLTQFENTSDWWSCILLLFSCSV